MSTTVSKNRIGRGRPEGNVKMRKWTVTIPESVAVRFEDRFTDPRTGATKVGARQEAISELLTAAIAAADQGMIAITLPKMFVKR